jgi:hypothetical protein
VKVDPLVSHVGFGIFAGFAFGHIISLSGGGGGI